MGLGDGIRRNVATISQDERNRLRDAFLALDSAKIYPDGVTYWDKQEEIHKNAHAAGQDVHGGPAFLPWHREICNRLEASLREVDPQLSLHYWDWTTDPRQTPNGVGGTVNLFSSDFMGSASGDAGAPFQNFESTEDAELHNGHATIWRNLIAGAPVVSSDIDITTSGDGLPDDQQYSAMDAALQGAHNYIHSGYIRGTIGQSHYSFHDPFVFLLHSNVDRLWACWQRAPGRSWRLDPARVYGNQGAAPSIVANLEPWSGGSGLRPWAPPDNQQLVKTPKDPSVVAPPAYDTPYPVDLRVPDLSRFATFVRILFGIVNDAPGLEIGPDGKPHPVDPWGPLLARLSPEKRDILAGLALTEVAPLVNDAASRAAVQEAGIKTMSVALHQLSHGKVAQLRVEHAGQVIAQQVASPLAAAPVVPPSQQRPGAGKPRA